MAKMSVLSNLVKLSVSMSYILFYSICGTVSQYSDHHMLLNLRLA